MTTKLKYALVMFCLILSYGLCAFAEGDTHEVIESPERNIDVATVSDLLGDDEDDPAYADFEPDYVFSETDESLLERDIGNY